MKLTINGKDIREMSVDQIGATLQQIASELSIRGNDVHAFPDHYARVTLLWAFEKAVETGDVLRRMK